MTDLGSVMYDVLPSPVTVTDYNHRADDLENGSVQKRPPKLKIGHKQPSTIMEGSETSLTDIGLIEEGAKDNTQSRSEAKRKSTGDIPANKYLLKDDNNARHSLCSDQDFGSTDHLTENDSLENVDKVTYTNVVADITVHSNVKQVPLEKSDSQDNRTVLPDGYKNNGNEKCNSVENTGSIDVGQTDSKQVNSDLDTSHRDNLEVEVSTKHNVNYIENSKSSVNNQTSTGVKGTDLNENKTKGSVRFKDDENVADDAITPEKSVPVEGRMSYFKKDAAQKRETWATKKLKKTFGLKRDEEDAVDGKGM